MQLSKYKIFIFALNDQSARQYNGVITFKSISVIGNFFDATAFYFQGSDNQVWDNVK